VVVLLGFLFNTIQFTALFDLMDKVFEKFLCISFCF
jgi:hypothetical protein